MLVNEENNIPLFFIDYCLTSLIRHGGQASKIYLPVEEVNR